MGSTWLLFKRDMKNGINSRVFILLGFMVLLQIWFIFGSGSVKMVTETGEMQFMAIVFSFNLFGSIIALALSHDSISTERENKVMDLILTSGISKSKVVWGKVFHCFVSSILFAGLYVTIMALIYLVASGKIGISMLAFRYLLPVTAFMSIYGLLGLMLSISMRSSRQSLIVSVIAGGLFIPRLYVTMIDGLGNAIGLGRNLVEMLYMLSPALIMNALSGYGEAGSMLQANILLALYLTGMILISIKTFIGQDELNYGE